MEVEKGSGAVISLEVNKVVYSEVTPGEAGPEKPEQGSNIVPDASKCTSGSELPSRGSSIPKREVPKRQIPRKDSIEHDSKSNKPEIPQPAQEPEKGARVLMNPRPSKKGKNLPQPQLESSSCAAHSPSSKASRKENINSRPQCTVPDGTEEEEVLYAQLSCMLNIGLGWLCFWHGNF